MNDVEFRKMQEALSNLLKVKDEMAKALFELYRSYCRAGFTKEQSLHLIVEMLRIKG